MKEITFTCDMCKKHISNYGVGYATDNSLVIIEATTLEIGPAPITYHLHFGCYNKLVKFMEE